MNKQANVREFRKLEAEIDASEADVQAKRWRQAELAATAVAEGMSRVEYGREVKKSDQTIGIYVRAWERWGASPARRRPLWADAWATVKARSDEVVTRADQRGREEQRQMPTRHEDRVEMAAKLLADPKVAKAAAKTVLDTSTKAGRVLAQAAHDAERAQRQKDAERNLQRRQDKAMPLPAHMAKMVMQMNEWTRGMHALRDDLDDLPESRGRELVAKAAADLAEEAWWWADRLEPGKPQLRIINAK